MKGVGIIFSNGKNQVQRREDGFMLNGRKNKNISGKMHDECYHHQRESMS